MNTQTTQHKITYKGYAVTIKGSHALKFAKVSKMSFEAWIGNRGVNINKDGLQGRLDHLISEIAAANEREAYYNSYKDFSTEALISDNRFAYARFQNSSYGDYYNLYWKSPYSPTGVEMVGGCTVDAWEEISKEVGKSHNYLSPTEGRMTAR